MREESAPPKRRGRPPLPAEKGKRYNLGIRTTKEIKDLLQSAADSAGRSMAQEIEHRLERSFDRQGALDEAFQLAYGDRAGLMLLLGALVRIGGGSRALVELLRRLDLPEHLQPMPEKVAQGLIWTWGYDHGIDEITAEYAAKRREEVGPEVARCLVEAYHKLRADGVYRAREMSRADAEAEANEINRWREREAVTRSPECDQ